MATVEYIDRQAEMILRDFKYEIEKAVRPLTERIGKLEVAERGDRKAERREIILGMLGFNFDPVKADEMLKWLSAGEETANG